MYNNLLYYLVVITVVSLFGSPGKPVNSLANGVAIWLVSLLGYAVAARSIYGRVGLSSARYFRAERFASILAVAVFVGVFFTTDLKFYLEQFTWNGRLSSLGNIAGLGVFFCYLVLMWTMARPGYQRIFGGSSTGVSFYWAQMRVNLPVVLPWILLSLLADGVALLPWPGLQKWLGSRWGEFSFSLVFFVTILLVFPPLVRRLWGCVPLPDGSVRRALLVFCARQKFFTELYLWPLFEGRALTAGVVGFVPGLRFILITPGLLEALTLEELEAVMAHEIGHVKKRHLLLYFLLVVGFGLVAGLYAEPMTMYLLSRDFFFVVLEKTGVSAEVMLMMITILPLLILMLLYFRYLFGYFIRNFERQADLHVFEAMGCGRGSRALISALEKIALLSGNIRDQPSWHHFGIGERVAYIEKCEEDPRELRWHQQKVWGSLILYLLGLAVTVGGAIQLPLDEVSRRHEEKYIETALRHKIEQEPDKALWLRLAGDLMQQRHMEEKALAAYEQALALEPENPELLNNLAWLLLTSDAHGMRDSHRALELSRKAVRGQRSGANLDTLALALWMNGHGQEAVAVEEEAVLADPDGREYYQQQIRRFRRGPFLPGSDASDLRR